MVRVLFNTNMRTKTKLLGNLKQKKIIKFINKIGKHQYDKIIKHPSN